MPRASEMLQALKTALTGFAPNWTVLAAPNETYTHLMCDMAISGSQYGGFVFGCSEVVNRVSVRLTLAAEPDKQASYQQLCDAVDDVMTRVFEQTEALATQGYQLVPNGIDQGTDPITPVAEKAGGKLFWSIEIFLPFRRRF